MPLACGLGPSRLGRAPGHGMADPGPGAGDRVSGWTVQAMRSSAGIRIKEERTGQDARLDATGVTFRVTAGAVKGGFERLPRSAKSASISNVGAWEIRRPRFGSRGSVVQSEIGREK